MSGGIAFFRRSGGSGEIRATQIAEYLGAKINPKTIEQDDICVYVKMQPPDNHPNNSYLDIIDENKRIKWLKNNPDVGVIASSYSGFQYLRGILGNKVVFIPQHHCNYDREISVWHGGKVGVIGGNGAVQADIGINYKHETQYKTRQDVVNFYKTIDIQVIWRTSDRPLKNPLKIINAMSFGIPTIAHPEIAYFEIEGYYERADTIKELTEKISAIQYTDRQRLINKAEEYHIENIAKLYRELL